jgi:hypothetical protein
MRAHVRRRKNGGKLLAILMRSEVRKEGSHDLSAIGAEPHFEPPSFPMRSPYAPEFQFLLTPLDEGMIERLLYIERPDGMDSHTRRAP